MHRAVLIASLFTCTMVMALAQPERPRLPLQTASTAELPVRMQLTNDMTIELLGRCLIYSVSYQRMVFPRLGLEGGFAALGGSDASLLFFSAGARLYLTESNISPYIAGG
ncbi:MAG: hypothetical protein HY962_09805, partial [Ignavibacteriae bacterium]|nr:hypothetical protein [Ignavibacteriota bacterium]